MAGNFADRFAPIEIIFELRAGLHFVRHDFRFHHAFAPVKIAQFRAGIGVVAHAFGNDVARPGQRGGNVSHAFFGTDIFRGLGLRIGGGLLLEQNVRQRFQPLFLGNRRPRAPFRAIRQINVFELRDGIRQAHRRLKFIGKQIAFGQRFEDSVAAIVQIGQADQPLADVQHRDFVE